MTSLIIIGGGIGGAAAAACLRRRGVEALVYEQVPATCEGATALALWPNATRVLRQVGALERLTQCGHLMTVDFLRDSRGRVIAQTALPEMDSPALAIHRTEVLAALINLVPPGSMHWGKRFLRTEHDGARVRAVFTNGAASPWADGLIGADGSQSAVWAQNSGNDAPSHRGCVVWRGMAECPSHEMAGETWRRRQGFGILPLGTGENGNTRAGWWAAAPVRHPAQLILHATRAQWKAELRRFFGGWHSPIPAIIEATPAECLLCDAVAGRHSLWRNHAGTGPITFVGDAAHATTPSQGPSMAIEDAAVLANAVEAIPDPASAFRVYEATRRERTARTARRHRCLDELWRYDAWSAPLMMPSDCLN